MGIAVRNIVLSARQTIAKTFVRICGLNTSGGLSGDLRIGKPHHNKLETESNVDSVFAT
ncbi:MAG: hypothetical protein Tsb009_17150 [Planctomycetaceae bacterium]